MMGNHEVTAEELAILVRSELEKIAALSSCDFSNCGTSRAVIEALTHLHTYLGSYLEKTQQDLDVIRSPHIQKIPSDAEIRSLLGRHIEHQSHPDHPTRELPSFGELENLDGEENS